MFLRLLPRSGTGQHLTTYQSLLTGPDPAGQGPRELHVVLLDNGRSRIVGDEVMRQTLACIRCGACLKIYWTGQAPQLGYLPPPEIATPASLSAATSR